MRGDLARVEASAMQEQLWVSQILHGDPGEYVLPDVLRVLGRIDDTRLADALRRVVARHEAVRTTFEFDGDRLWQVVHRDGAVPVESHMIDGNDPDSDFLRLLRETARSPMPLEDGPLFRCVVGHAERSTYLALLTHHIVADGWSMAVLLGDLDRCYRGGAPRPTRQYREFAATQRAWLAERPVDDDTAGFAASLDYWRQQLHDAPSGSTFAPATTRGRPRRAARLTVRMSADATAAVHGAVAGLGTTAFAVQLTAYATVLARRTGNTDVVVGVPSANRTSGDFDTTVGPFVNVLPIRVRIGESASPADAVGSVTDTLLDALAYEQVPFGLIVTAVGGDRERVGTPLFQTAFDARLGDDMCADFGAYPAERIHVPPNTAKYDLRISVPADDSGMIVVDYDAGLFSARDIDAIMRDYLETLTSTRGI